MIAKIPRFWPSPFLLAAHLERGEDQGQWLRELARWVDDEESRARNARSKERSSLPSWGAWLAGSSPLRDRAAVWRSLAHRILARPESPHPSDAAEALRLLGERVAGIDSSNAMHTRPARF